MREETVVMATGTQGASRYVPNAERLRSVREQRAKVNARGRRHFPSRQLPVDVRAHLVALSADGGAEVYPQFGCDEAPMRQRGHSLIEYPRRGPSPSRVQ